MSKLKEAKQAAAKRAPAKKKAPAKKAAKKASAKKKKSDGKRKPNAAEARESLKAAVGFLLKTPNVSKRLEYVATTIQEFLDGEHGSLDRAFRLSLGSGDYDRKEDSDLLEKVYGVAHMVIFDEISFPLACSKLNYDVKQFRPIWNRYVTKAMERIVEESIPLSEILETQGGHNAPYGPPF